MTGNEILEKRFDRAAVGGYKAEDVNSFVLSVADEIDKLNKEKADLQGKLVVLADHLEDYRKDEESMRSALLGAQKLGDQIVKESKEEAEKTVSNARREADDIIDKARADAVMIQSNAKKDLENETLALHNMKREVSRFRKQLLAQYKQHVTLIESLYSQKDENNSKTEGKSGKYSNTAVNQIQEQTIPQSKKEEYSRKEKTEDRLDFIKDLQKKDFDNLEDDKIDTEFKPMDFKEDFRFEE